jgi:hypothetical protein
MIYFYRRCDKEKRIYRRKRLELYDAKGVRRSNTSTGAFYCI